MSTQAAPVVPRVQTPVQSTAVPPTAGSPSLLRFAFAAIVVLAFSFLLWQHAQALWRLTYYQFFPFVLLGAALLAWARWDDVETLAPGSGFLSTLGFLAAWVFLAVAEILVAPGIAYVGALIFVAAGLYRLGGSHLFRVMLPAWAFLWILVPLPFRLGQYLLLVLQSVATQWSSFVLDLLGVFHFRDGNVIQIAGQSLLVEEACTGANSLFAVMACCLFLIFWMRQRWYRALVLLCASFVWVLVTNVVRIVTVAVARDKYGVDLGTGVPHDLLGFACFALAIMLIFSTDRLMLFFFPRWGDERPQPVREGPPPTLTFAAVAGLCSAPLAIAFGLPLAFHLAAPMLDVTPPHVPGAAPIATVKTLNKETLENIAPDEWKLLAYNYDDSRKKGAEFGDYSNSWLFQQTNSELRALVSVDYPFPAYHDLWLCYETHGWDRVRTDHFPTDDDGKPFYRVVMKMKKKSAFHFAYVAYIETNAQGDVLPFQGRWKESVNRLEDSMKHWGDKLAGRPPQPIVPRAPVYQFQICVETTGEIKPDQERAVSMLLLKSFFRLHNQLFPAPKAE